LINLERGVQAKRGYHLSFSALNVSANIALKKEKEKKRSMGEARSIWENRGRSKGLDCQKKRLKVGGDPLHTINSNQNGGFSRPRLSERAG